MKKVIVFLTALIMAIPIISFCAPSVTLRIDSVNVYGGMNRAYKDGYSPTVSGDRVQIILPLLASGPIAGNTITATPDLGDPLSSPFVFNNYEKNITLATHSINGGSGNIQGFYVGFDLPLSSSRSNGTYPVVIKVSGFDSGGDIIEQTFTTYVRITDSQSSVENPPVEAPPAEVKPQSKPILLVESSEITPSPITAGDEFFAKVLIKNTSTKKSVQNIVFTISCESKGISLLNDSTTIYLSRLSSGKTHTLDLKFKTNAQMETGDHSIKIAMSYDDSDAVNSMSEGSVFFEVVQPLKLKLNIPEIPTNVNAGDVLPLTLQAMNMGRSGVYNVRCELDIDGLSSSTTPFFGNMDPGTDKTADMNIFIGTKKQPGEQYGLTNGKLTLLYEDQSGKNQTQVFEISTTIGKPIISDTKANADNKRPKGQWWITAIMGVGILGAGGWYLWQKRKGKLDENS